MISTTVLFGREYEFLILNSKFLEQVAKLARSRVAANGAAPPGAEPWAVTSALLASTRWGCSRTG
ncbi:MAG TPA: hypothetical protein VKE96_09755, partial [Vicinamibacterales bacterium]|nr:hypothetical protein [Vicinamibacterales bacterium]